VVLAVLPYVELDLVSYSSYDTECIEGTFPAALAFIDAHHNKTELTPSPVGVYVGEYGLPISEFPLPLLQDCIENVVSTAIDFGAPYIMFWEIYDNEAQTSVSCCSCSALAFTRPRPSTPPPPPQII
jgi:hypothetical protein